ncbi:MAG TPA: prephenate dehydratase [Fimbriimonadaceae bacterium]|jgi:chorismate mutase/prephenate dehydratase
MSEEIVRSLPEIRVDIDEIDRNLVDLLNRRVKLAQEVGRVKGNQKRPFFTPERERDIFERLEEINPGPLQARQLKGIFREIISAARAAEKQLTASFWGPEGSFTHAAALHTFGTSSDLRSESTIEEVFQAVERGDSDYGVVPVENSVAGMVPETLDMFFQADVKICAEIYLPIHHHLASIAEALEAVERIYAGPQPEQQCRKWLRAYLKGADIIETMPTSLAAHRALEDKKSGAIVNRMAAEMLGLPILAEHIEDNPNNKTRFLVLGFNEPAKTGRDKTSLMLNLRNRPGELYRALGALEQESLNVVVLEARPAPRSSFEYLFFVDIRGHKSEEPVKRAIEDLRSSALETTVLGSYPTSGD